tara:strand:+ start:3023 stop:3202 length:180 start_codon:yes stop_codon:yes gene_type:complete
MNVMDGISKELNEQIELECEIRRLKLLADKLEAINRPKTRRAIEELKELNESKRDYYED